MRRSTFLAALVLIPSAVAVAQQMRVGTPVETYHATPKSYVDSGLATKAPIASPALTGTPTAPTRTPGNNSTAIATTAYVDAADAAISSGISATATSAANAAVTAAIPTVTANANSYTDTQIATRAPLASPQLTGQVRVTDSGFPTLDFSNPSGVVNRRFSRNILSSDGNYYLQFFNDDFSNGRNALAVDAQSGRVHVPSFALMNTNGFLKQGNQTSTAGGNSRVDWEITDGKSGGYNGSDISSEGGIWPDGKVYSFMGIGATFDASSLPAPHGTAPFNGLFVKARNQGTTADVVGLMTVAVAGTSGGTVFGNNTIARTDGGLSNVKLVGMEVDVEPADGVSTAAGSGGIFINAFSELVNGPAIQLGGVSGGHFANGIGIAGIASNGAGLFGIAGEVMGSLVNSGPASYLNDNAIVMNRGHYIQFGEGSTWRMGLDGAGAMRVPVVDSTTFLNDGTGVVMQLKWNGQVTVPNLAGTGNGYVCVNSSGTMFRSGTPCV